MLALFSGCVSDDKGSLSDGQLLQYAKSPFNKEEMEFKDIVIGYHNGIPVRVTFPCSDVCPDYTVGVIRYDVENAGCGSAGGELKSIPVPMGIESVYEEFCFPKAIVENGIYEFA